MLPFLEFTYVPTSGYPSLVLSRDSLVLCTCAVVVLRSSRIPLKRLWWITPLQKVERLIDLIFSRSFILAK